MKRLAKITLGSLALIIGSAILIWCAYSFVVPNENFRFRLIDTPRLLFPLVMIWVGWRWIRGERAGAPGYTSELMVTLKLSDSDFGTEAERRAILDVKHRLEGALRVNETAAIDGEEFGDGECTLFVHTNSPAEAERLIRQFFSSHPSSFYTLTNSQE